MSLPDSTDPAVWLRVIGELEAERDRMLEGHAEVELDGAAAALRRACDRVLGRAEPIAHEPSAAERAGQP